MTREECIDTLKGIKAYYTNERDFSYYEEYEPLGEGDNEALDMAIEALEQDPKPLDDGTLCITVDDYSKVQRVLVQDNNKWGGLYYPEQEPTEDCISRQAVMDIMHEMWGDSGELIDALRKLPPVQPKHGEWKKVSMDKYIRHSQYYYRCSECGENTIGEHNYCPNCGSRMDKQICQEVRYERYIR